MAGTLYPADGPRSDNPAEALLWRALARQLPDTWRAWHSLKLRTAQGQFGEGDFVVADPERGYLVIEVKGGKVSSSGGHWFYGKGTPMERSPLEQAHHYGGKLKRELSRVWPQDSVPSGVACCLPETPAERGPSNSDLRDVMIDAIDLGDLVAALRRAFNATIAPGNAPKDRSWIDALTQLWGDDWEPRVGLLGRARLHQQTCERLNEQQLRALAGLSSQRRMIVSGGAGTGKSTVALRIAEERAWAGKTLTYLCFTRPLARWAHQQLAAPREQLDLNIAALTVHDLAVALANGWKLDVPAAPSAPSEWDAVLRAVSEQPLDRAVDGSKVQVPEVLVIDEAQSFSADDWALVDRLRSPTGSEWIFRDPAQAFWEERPLPERYSDGVVDYQLQRQERMPRSLAAIAQAYAGGSRQAAIEAFDADSFKVVVSDDDARPALVEEISALLRLGFGPGQIGVITLVGQTASKLWGEGQLGPHRVVNAEHDDAPDQIVVETFLRFQGLDRAVLLLCEGHLHAAKHRYEARMHMALTRATTSVIVFAAAELWERDPLLAALRAKGVL